MKTEVYTDSAVHSYVHMYIYMYSTVVHQQCVQLYVYTQEQVYRHCIDRYFVHANMQVCTCLVVYYLSKHVDCQVHKCLDSLYMWVSKMHETEGILAKALVFTFEIVT